MRFFRTAWALACTIAILASLLGCSLIQDAPLTTHAVVDELEKMADNNTVLVFEVNPAQTYPISVTPELLHVLQLNEWSVCSEITHNDDKVKKIYFDLPHEDALHYSRVVIFSDGTAFIQVYNNEGYKEKVYYQFDNTQVYNNIISYILTCYSTACVE